MSDPDGREIYRLEANKAAKKAEGRAALDSASTECMACGHRNLAGSRFCTECGREVAGAQKCPNCKAPSHPGSDICEGCGAWLLPGKCKFCMANVLETDEFCSECGNPQAGITCPRCGALSIFDFCKNCLIPLSRDGQDQITLAKVDPTHGELLTALLEIASIASKSPDKRAPANQPSATTGALKEQLLQMHVIRKRAELGAGAKYDKESPKRALFTEMQQEQIGLLDAQIEAEEERKRVEIERLRIEAERKREEDEERRRVLIDQVNRALQQISRKTFSSGQAARRYYMSIISALPEQARASISISGQLRWRCHAYSNEHNGPSECADPSKGGVWLIR